MEEEATPAIFQQFKEEEVEKEASIKEMEEMEEIDEIEDEAVHNRRLLKKYNLSKG